MNLQFSEYAAKCWEQTLGSSPVAQLEFWDGDPNHDDYGIDQIHLVKLADKRYAVIHEYGCSCYDYSEARMTAFDKKKDALAEYKTLVKGKTR